MKQVGLGIGDRIVSAQVAVGRATAECDGLAELFARFSQVAAAAVDASSAAFWRLDPDGETGVAVMPPVPPGLPQCAGAIARDLLGEGGELRRRDRVTCRVEKPGWSGSVVAVAWRAGDVQIGGLFAYSASPDAFTDDDALVLHVFANSVGNVFLRETMLEQLRSAMAGLHEAEERLARVLSISQTLNSILDPDQLIETLARQAMELLGCDAGFAGLRRPEGMVSRKYLLGGDEITFEYCWPPGHGVPGWCLANKLPYLRNDLQGDLQIVPELRDRFGMRRILCTPIVDAQEEILGFVALVDKREDFDEDDREVMSGLANHAAMSLRNALAYRSLDELEQFKSDFLNLAAHELRGPVATARGYLEMLGDEPDRWQPAQREAMLGITASKLDHIRFLVDQMLATARLEDQPPELDREDLDLRELVESALGDVSYAVKPLHRLRVELGPDPILVSADRRRIQAALANLIENACKYSPDGGEVRVRSTITGTPACAEVMVEDDGVGIDQGDMPRLFTRFGRIVTPENSHISGTGLGLYLSRQLVMMHGGDITVQSAAGEGSAFRLRMPLASADHPDKPPSQDMTPAAT